MMATASATSLATTQSISKSSVRGLAADRLMEWLGCPLKEDTVWAICYQCCKHLLDRDDAGQIATDSALTLASIVISVEGDVFVPPTIGTGAPKRKTMRQVLNELGCLLFSLLDYGLMEDEERTLSPSLESLIDWLTVNRGNGSSYTDCSNSSIADYDSGTESMMDYGSPASLAWHNSNPYTMSVPIDNLSDVLQMCEFHVEEPLDPSDYYRSLCAEVVKEAISIIDIMNKCNDNGLNKWKEKRKELFSKLMSEIQQGVKLKHVSDDQLTSTKSVTLSQHDHLLMSISHFDKKTLSPVSITSDASFHETKSPSQSLTAGIHKEKNVHDSIMEQIKAKPSLKPVESRSHSSVSMTLPRIMSPMELLMEDIQRPHTLNRVHRDSLVFATSSSASLCRSRSTSCLDDYRQEMALLQRQMSPVVPSIVVTTDLEASASSATGSTDWTNEYCDMVQHGRYISEPQGLRSGSSIMDINTDKALLLPENEFEAGQQEESCQSYCEDDEGRIISTMSASKISHINVTNEDEVHVRRTSSLSKRFSSSLKNLSLALSQPPSSSLWSKIKANFTTLSVKDEPSIHRSSSLNDTKWCDDHKDDRQRKVFSPLSLTEVIKIRTTVTRAELVDIQLRDTPLHRQLVGKQICFVCQEKKFGFFNTPQACFICYQYVCSQCIGDKSIVEIKYSELPRTRNICICCLCVNFMLSSLN